MDSDLQINLVNGKRDEAVIFIANPYFPLIPKIREYIEKTSRCYVDDSFKLYSNSNMLIYYKANYLKSLVGKREEFSLEVLDNNVQDILGFIRVEIYTDKYIGIYDECVEPTDIDKSIIQGLIKYYSGRYDIRVISRMQDFDRNNKFDLYRSLGFIFEAFMFQKSNGTYAKEIFTSMFLSKTPQKNLETIKKRNMKMFQRLDKLKCSYNIFINWEELKYISDKTRGESVEYGGIFLPTETSHGGRTLFNLDRNSVVAGDENSVKPPNSKISWHSHPLVCYQRFVSDVLWPSGADMRYCFSNYFCGGLLLHLLFANEGIYTIKLTEAAMKFIHIISFVPEWISAMGELIFIRFTDLENLRQITSEEERQKCLNGDIGCLRYPPTEKEANIKKYLHNAKTNGLRMYLIDQKYKNNWLFKYGYNLNDLNSKAEEAIGYYENFTNTVADFPLFETEFKGPIFLQKEGFKYDLKYLRSPNDPTCF